MLGVRKPFCTGSKEKESAIESRNEKLGTKSADKARAKCNAGRYSRGRHRSRRLRLVDLNFFVLVQVSHPMPSLHSISPRIPSRCLQSTLRPHHCGRRLNAPSPPSTETTPTAPSPHAYAWDSEVRVCSVRVENHILRPHRPTTTTIVVWPKVPCRSAHLGMPRRVHRTLGYGCEVTCLARCRRSGTIREVIVAAGSRKVGIRELRRWCIASAQQIWVRRVGAGHAAWYQGGGHGRWVRTRLSELGVDIFIVIGGTFDGVTVVVLRGLEGADLGELGGHLDRGVHNG